MGRKRRGSPKGRIFWWEAVKLAVGGIVRKWSGRIAGAMGTAALLGWEFYTENKSLFIGAANVFLVMALVMVIGTIATRQERKTLKETDNRDRKVV